MLSPHIPPLSDLQSPFNMPCSPVNPEEYLEIGIYTPVEYNSNSLDFLSRNPTLFMRAADSVYMKGDSIIAKWSGGPYRLSNGDTTHCGKALLVVNIACKGNMPRISLNGFFLKKTKRGAFGHTKRFQSIWIHPFGYPVLSRIGPVAAPEECPETDLISLGHFATYLQWLTGSNGYGAPGVKDYYPVNSFIEYLLDFEVLGEVDAYSCGICPSSHQFENSDEEFKTMRRIFEGASKSPAEHYALISVITLIAAGAVLKGTIPLRVAIPYDCGVWETYVTKPTPKADKLVIPQRGCDGWAYWLPSKGAACFSIEEEPPDGPPGRPSLPSGATYDTDDPPPPPLPPGSKLGPLGWEMPPSPVHYPCSELKRRCVTMSGVPASWTNSPGWPVKRVGDPYGQFYIAADGTYVWPSGLITLLDDGDLWAITGTKAAVDLNTGKAVTLTTYEWWYREAKCFTWQGVENGVSVSREVAGYTGRELRIPIFPNDPKAFVGAVEWSVGSCSGQCLNWRMEIIFKSNGVKPYPKGYQVRNYVLVECGSKPGLETIDGVAHITCGGESMGPIGWAASMYIWFEVSLGKVECAN